MDILYKLPFPHDVCSKILTFCKSSHSDLDIGILKIRIGLPIFNILSKKDGIVLDHEGHVEVITNSKLSSAEDKQLNFDIARLESLQKLSSIGLYDTSVTGNIVVLKALRNLILRDWI